MAQYHNLQLCAKLSIFLHVCKLFITFASNEKILRCHIRFSRQFFCLCPRHLLPSIFAHRGYPSRWQSGEICTPSHHAHGCRVRCHFSSPMDSTQRLESCRHRSSAKLLVLRRQPTTRAHRSALCFFGSAFSQTTPFSVGHTSRYRHRIRYQNIPKHHPIGPTLSRTRASQSKHRKCYQFSFSRSSLFGVPLTQRMEYLSSCGMVPFQQR